MVMIEAMAVGCPVIAFRRGAVPEIVIHGKSGFLVNDVNEMVLSIARIDELDREVVRAHVEQHFTSHIMAQKYTKVYKKVIASMPEKVLTGHGLHKKQPFVLTPPSTAPLPSTHGGTEVFPRIVKRTVEA